MALNETSDSPVRKMVFGFTLAAALFRRTTSASRSILDMRGPSTTGR